MASAADVEAWGEERPGANIGLRLPPGVIGIDADAHKGEAEAAAWQELISECGPLPAAPWCTSRDDGISGIRLFTVPDGYVAADLGPAGEVIQHHHRYVVAPPSISPPPPLGSNQPYRWVGAHNGYVPSVADLPMLPAAWLNRLQAAQFQQPAQRKETSWTSPDIGELVTGGIPSDQQQEPRLRDLVFECVRPGGCILDVPAVPAAVWGDDDDILWAEGQSLIIAGPDGTGKTTLAGNLIHARLGLGTGTVLSLPVKPGSRNILLLFMDRPQQAMAAFARLFTDDDRALLDARSVVWRGPPPQDLARHTGMLAHLCLLADADTCVIDSLKDAALKLSDDETGAGWNQARQIAIEAGTELLELHHPRKAQEGNRKPRKLDDLYGSRWIPAGAGSVISLWGQAGDPVVDLTHLKPVVTTAGPWQMTIDGETGIVSIDRGVDLVEQIRYRKEGITAVVAARLLTGAESPGKAAIEKARRKLDRKVAEGLLVRHDGRPGGVHGGVHATWHLAPFTEAFTDRSRPGQAFTHTEELPRSRTGGDISPPERERWSPGTDAGPRPGESPLGYAQRLRRERTGATP